MKWFCSSALALVAMIATTTAQAQTNLLTDGGFEDPSKYTQDGDVTPFVGNWEAFDGDGVASSTHSTANPRTGTGNSNLNITNADNSFAGLFQDVPGLVAGQPIRYSGWNKTVGTFDIGAEFRIEWRNSVSNTEISRTANIVPTLSADYTQFSFEGNVPAGVNTARVVYAIQSFGAGGTNNGTVVLDDLSFQIVPEPASAALVLSGSLGLMAAVRRRRSA
jgi:hypothetical protein